MEHYILGPSLCFLFCLIQLTSSHTRLMARQFGLCFRLSLTASKHQNGFSSLFSSYCSDRPADTGQRDRAFGCVPQAFRKAPLCFTIGNICFGKMAFNRRTESISLRVQNDDKQMVCCDLCLGCWCGDTIALMEYDRRREGREALNRR